MPSKAATKEPPAPGALPPVETLEELPAGFPGDMPVYPGAKTIQGARRGSTEKMAVFEAEASPAEVADYYKRELLAQGWSLEGEVELDGETMISVEKGGRKAGVMILSIKAGSQIAVSVSDG